MMISPAAYYEMYLKGKNPTQIMDSIKGLKREIDHLKNTMESPDYAMENLTLPDVSTIFSCTCTYLQIARTALTEAGGNYIPSKVEVKCAKFDSNINQISNITFTLDMKVGDSMQYLVDLIGNTMSVTLKHLKQFLPRFPTSLKLLTQSGKIMSKQDFLDAIKVLNIGEWRKSYTIERFETADVKFVVFDGMSWSLHIDYKNALKSEKFSGTNSFPYNFDKLKELFDRNEVLEDNYFDGDDLIY